MSTLAKVSKWLLNAFSAGLGSPRLFLAITMTLQLCSQSRSCRVNCDRASGMYDATEYMPLSLVSVNSIQSAFAAVVLIVRYSGFVKSNGLMLRNVFFLILSSQRILTRVQPWSSVSAKKGTTSFLEFLRNSVTHFMKVERKVISRKQNKDWSSSQLAVDVDSSFIYLIAIRLVISSRKPKSS
jgi:hypothetical protein